MIWFNWQFRDRQLILPKFFIFQVTKFTWGNINFVTHVPILTVHIYITMNASTETQGGEDQERVELPEIHFSSPETDPFFFPRALTVKGKGHCHENGLHFAGTGWSGNCYVWWSNDVIAPNTGLLALTATFHSHLLSSVAYNFIEDSFFDQKFPMTELALCRSSLKIWSKRGHLIWVIIREKKYSLSQKAFHSHVARAWSRGGNLEIKEIFNFTYKNASTLELR